MLTKQEIEQVKAKMTNYYKNSETMLINAGLTIDRVVQCHLSITCRNIEFRRKTGQGLDQFDPSVESEGV